MTCEICNFHQDKDDFMSFSITHPVLQVSSSNHQLNTSSILEESYVDIKRKSSRRNDFTERKRNRRNEWLRRYQRESRKLSKSLLLSKERKKSLVLCDNCANALEKKLRRDMEDATKILQMYETYDCSKSINSNSSDESLSLTSKDIDEKMKQEEHSSHKMALRVPYFDVSRTAHQVRLARRSAEEACRDADEFRDRQIDERDRLLRKLENIKRETKRFKSLNALSDVCCIWYDQKWDFGKISSLRLGT